MLEVLSETGMLGLLCWIAGTWFALRAWWRADAVARARAFAPALALVAMCFPLNTHLAFYSAWWGLLFWWLLRTHFRGDRRAERIRLYRDRLVLQQIDAKGRVTETHFEPYWLRVVLAERGFENPALLLRSHGASIEIGTFLGAQERRDFAAELTRVLSGWRTA